MLERDNAALPPPPQLAEWARPIYALLGGLGAVALAVRFVFSLDKRGMLKTEYGVAADINPVPMCLCVTVPVFVIGCLIIGWMYGPLLTWLPRRLGWSRACDEVKAKAERTASTKIEGLDQEQNRIRAAQELLQDRALCE